MRLRRLGRLVPRFLPLVLTLFGAALRWYDTSARSLWFDEAITLYRISGSWADNLINRITILGSVSTDTHPALYFLLLKAWVLLLDDREFLLRFFSATVGILVVPAVWLLARVAFGWRTAAVAALLALLAPVMQWYSHELRNYALTVVLAAISTAAMLRVGRQRPGALRVWLLGALLSCITHYALLVMVGVQLAVLIFGARADFLRQLRVGRVLLGLSAICALVIAALLLPQVAPRLFSGAEQDFNFVGLHQIWISLLASILFGLNLILPYNDAIALGLGALAVIAFVVAARNPNTTQQARLLGAVTLLPVLLWFGLSFIKPNFQGVRHLIVAVPLLIVWIAHATQLALRRVPALGGVLLFTLLVAQAYGLMANHARTSGLHDDWRAMGNYLRESWHDGDVLAAQSGLDMKLVQQYASPAMVNGQLAAELPALQTQGRVFLILPSDRNPARLQVQSKNEFLRLRNELSFGGRSVTVRLGVYESVAGSSLQAMPGIYERVPAGSAPANATRLTGFDIGRGNAYSRNPNLYLRLAWLRGAEQASDVRNWRANLRLLHNGQLWWQGDVESPIDTLVQGMGNGEAFVTHHFLPVPLGLPNLPYEIELRVVSPRQVDPIQQHRQQLLKVTVDCCVRQLYWFADAQDSARLLYPPEQRRTLALAEPVLWRIPGAELAVAELASSVRSGTALPVVLTWRALSPGLQQSETQLELLDVWGNRFAVEPNATTTGGFEWPVNQNVREPHSLAVPQDTPAGLYRLVLAQARGDASQRHTLNWVNVLEFPREAAAQVVANRLTAQVGGIRLLGWQTASPFKPGSDLQLRTFWQVIERPDPDGVIFMHLRADGVDGAVKQHDLDPRNGQRNSRSYRVGEGIEQIHDTITLPQDLPDGDYTLLAGIYDRSSGQRWLASQNGQRAQDDLIVVHRFKISTLVPVKLRMYLPVVAR